MVIYKKNKYHTNTITLTDGCVIGGPLSATLSDTWMVKIDNNTIVPHKPKAC